MKSNNQTLQISAPHLKFDFISFNRINLTKRLLMAISQVGLIGIMTLTAAVSSAAPDIHANPNAVGVTTPRSSSSTGGSTEEWARGRILVMPRAGLPAHAFAAILKEHAGKARKIGQSDLYIVDLPEFSEEGAIAGLQHNPHIKFAELDRVVLPALTPNDPYFYGGAADTWHHFKINTPLAWDTTEGVDITIAILDSGVDGTHPDLSPKMVPGWNFYDNNSNTSPVTSHGTTVAGTAAAITNNDIGIAGVAGKSFIMPLRVSDTSGNGYSSTIAQGLTYAADHGAHVANAGFQGITSSLTVQNAAQYMKDKGGLVLVPAGNTGNRESYTITSTMIPISATDENDLKASFSSYGDYVALAAPGVKIWTTTVGGGYSAFSGTSQASPVAAGIVALMMAANPKLSNTEIENLLFSTAVDLGAAGRDTYYGYGRIDAAAAVQAAKSATATQDTEPPIVSIVDPLGGATINGLVPVDIDTSDNVGVARTELWVNNTSVAVDTSSPFAFSWDSSGTANGAANVVVRAYDAAGNMSSSNISVDVQNTVPAPVTDTTAPVVKIVNPVAGNVSGTITISVSASDDSGASGITLSIYIDGALKATGTGSTLSTSWNTRSKSVKAGSHTIQAVAKDAAGNTSTTSVIVKK